MTGVQTCALPIYPKPVELIKQIIRIATDDDDIILDFFAGSGTTGQAVLELNEEERGSRQFILATNNQNNICRDITYKRTQRIINGYTYKGQKHTILFEKKMTLTDLRKSESLLKELEKVKEREKNNFRSKQNINNYKITII